MHHLQTITTIATTIVVDAAGRDRNTRHLCDRSERISSEYKYIRFYWSVAFNLAHAQLAGSSLLLANAPLDVCNNRWLLSLSTLRCLSLYIFFVCAKCSACRHRRRHRRNRLHHFSVIFVFLCCFFFLLRISFCVKWPPCIWVRECVWQRALVVYTLLCRVPREVDRHIRVRSRSHKNADIMDMGSDG